MTIESLSRDAIASHSSFTSGAEAAVNASTSRAAAHHGQGSPTGADDSCSRPVLISELVGRPLAEWEKRAIIETLRACQGNKALTARTLGISEKSIYNKMRRHDLRPPKLTSSAD